MTMQYGTDDVESGRRRRRAGQTPARQVEGSYRVDPRGNVTPPKELAPKQPRAAGRQTVNPQGVMPPPMATPIPTISPNEYQALMEQPNFGRTVGPERERQPDNWWLRSHVGDMSRQRDVTGPSGGAGEFQGAPSTWRTTVPGGGQTEMPGMADWMSGRMNPFLNPIIPSNLGPNQPSYGMTDWWRQNPQMPGPGDYRTLGMAANDPRYMSNLVGSQVRPEIRPYLPAFMPPEMFGMPNNLPPSWNPSWR